MSSEYLVETVLAVMASEHLQAVALLRMVLVVTTTSRLEAVKRMAMAVETA
jgi:hypothetical protein